MYIIYRNSAVGYINTWLCPHQKNPGGWSAPCSLQNPAILCRLVSRGSYKTKKTGVELSTVCCPSSCVWLSLLVYKHHRYGPAWLCYNISISPINKDWHGSIGHCSMELDMFFILNCHRSQTFTASTNRHSFSSLDSYLWGILTMNRKYSLEVS